MDERCDVLVVGAGIHGAGVAQAAAAAGHDVLVLERREAVGTGTSGRSSKLIHGGLRYLEGGHFGLVRESLRERRILRRVAPGLVRLRPFYFPIYRDTRRRPLTVRVGLSLYALLGGLRPENRFASIARREWAALDGLDTGGLEAVFRYRDAQTDDTRLTRAVMDSARSLGARLVMPGSLQACTLTADGCEVRYCAGDAERRCTARVLVNAAGPWVNRVLERVTPRIEARPIELVQGAHVILDRPLRAGIYYVEAPSDRRAVFCMPWGDHAMVGTTETAFEGDPDDVAPLPAEVDYLRAVHARYFPQAADAPVIGSFAGLRVLPAGTGSLSKRSRETMLDTDRASRPRILIIYGGKLTTFRATAAQVMARIADSLPPRVAPVDTAELPLGGAA